MSIFARLKIVEKHEFQRHLMLDHVMYIIKGHPKLHTFVGHDVDPMAHKEAIITIGNKQVKSTIQSNGAYETEDEAVRVQDLVALKLRKNDNRGTSRFKGASKHSSGKKWEARIGYTTTTSSAAAGGSWIIKKEDRYLCLHATEEEAARCVDMVALHFHAREDAITNFAPSQYTKEMVQQHLERSEKKDYKIPPDLHIWRAGPSSIEQVNRYQCSFTDKMSVLQIMLFTREVITDFAAIEGGAKCSL
ncbi:unnamed protein product [Sphagnum troendelagicum]|uniref:AP2/ERF domain-containing protein n=1 Tax=Sphagnum troendelagicum TaxID=128251 RepID=A0ABP0TGY8_9BRYO